MAADWQKVRALFDEAMTLASAQRMAWVHAATADEALRAEVLSLLAHAERAGEAGLSMGAPDLPGAAQAAAREGQRVGAWLITAPLGTGGMGEVLRARRADGAYEGEAAIKLLRRGMDSAALLARFALEQRALGRMNHPNIARLFDAGLTADQQPYFVMELVDGEPIDRAAQGQPIEQRLGLFLQLADAVAHAHRQLLVHRDLKPSNVLVDRRGQVKLLDFGIAKALEGDLASENSPGSAATTQQGMRPFTPLYASPEQVRGEPVGTATDIYSLGVLLYGLLTGQRPYGRAARTPVEAARAVLEEEPTRPSALSPGLAADPQWLAMRKRLRGDLDNIVLKALDKRAERRYATVDALAADVRAYLSGFPISARPASVAYQAQKFIWRHRWAALAAGLGTVGLVTGLASAWLNERLALALGALGLVGGLALALLQARQAVLARDRSQAHLGQVQALLRNLVAGHAEALAHVPGAFAAREAMLAEAATNLDRVAAQTGLDRQMLATLGGAFSRLADSQGNVQGEGTGKVEQARVNATRALRDFDAAQPRPEDPAEQHCWHARAFQTLARLERNAGRPAQALAMFQRGESILRMALPAHRGAGATQLREALALVLSEIGLTHDCQDTPCLNQPGPALAAFDEANRLFESIAGERPLPSVLNRRGTVLSCQAVVHDKHGDMAQAIVCLQAAEALSAEAVRVGDRPDTHHQFNLVAVRFNLGDVLLRDQRPEEAMGVFTLAWRGINELVRDNPGTVTWVQRRNVLALNYADALVAVGRYAEAEALLLPLVAHWENQTDDTSERRTGLAQLALARCALAEGDAAAARTRADAARARFARGVERLPGERKLLLYEARSLATVLRAGEPDPTGQIRRLALERFAEAEAMRWLAPDDRQVRDLLNAKP